MPGEPAELLVHATAVASGGACVLLLGPSGAGKSDLALRLMTLGAGDGLPQGGADPRAGRRDAFRLVSDDRVLLRRVGEHLDAEAPEPIFGKLEVRGVGIVEVPALVRARAALCVELVAAAQVPRLPHGETFAALGVVLPLVRLAAFEASAPQKVALALAAALAPDEA